MSDSSGTSPPGLVDTSSSGADQPSPVDSSSSAPATPGTPTPSSSLGLVARPQADPVPGPYGQDEQCPRPCASLACRDDPPYGPWRACCRCGEPIGDPPHHELQTFRGIFAEDANICSLGMTFDRCRHCGLPHHDLAVDPGQTDCHDLPCTGLGWAATPRASRSIRRIFP